ncbi:MAG: GH3 auxin-responsive promoter family protein [Chitinophagales bacterium]
MTMIGQLIKRTITVSPRLRMIPALSPERQQQKMLRRLLRKAAYTRFGLRYQFSEILRSENLIAAFQEQVPVHSYDTMFNDWWHRTLQGEENVCWPGKTKYFALSSGTAGTASKRIPLTVDMISAIKRGSIKQILSSRNFNLPASVYEKKILMLGGSTALNKRGDYFEGDLSGISAKKIPYWFQAFYKPGRKIAKEKNWDKKLNDIAKKSSSWDVSIMVGVPAWIQIMLEKIIEYNDVENIHDVWPNLAVYVHSGVSFEPYRGGFKKLLGRPILFQNTYLASEGHIAFYDHPDCKGMHMMLSNGIFFEFIPFDDQNFDGDGELLPSARSMWMSEVEEAKPYAIVLSTCAGSWRYLPGDVIEFTDKEKSQIVITGRTKHYLSLTGEHLSIDNMNRAISKVSGELNIDIREFTVAGIPWEGLFAHHWWIGCDTKVNVSEFKAILDKNLCTLNDDYATERTSALKEIIVDILPNTIFFEWMRSKGKLGGQHKFPRVMKGKQLEEWKIFLESKKSDIGKLK